MLADRAGRAGQPGQRRGRPAARPPRPAAGWSPPAGRAAPGRGQLADQVEAGRVERVQVLHDEHGRPVADQRPDGATASRSSAPGRVPLAGARPGAGPARPARPAGTGRPHGVAAAEHGGQPVVRAPACAPGPCRTGRIARARRDRSAAATSRLLPMPAAPVITAAPRAGGAAGTSTRPGELVELGPPVRPSTPASSLTPYVVVRRDSAAAFGSAVTMTLILRAVGQRLGPGPDEQRGLGLRRAAGCSRSRTAWAGCPRASWPATSSSQALAPLDDAGRPASRCRPARRARDGQPADQAAVADDAGPRRHGHDGDRAAARRRQDRRWCTSATRAATCCATAS